MPPSRPNRFTNLFNNGIAYLFVLLIVILTVLSLAGYFGKLNMYLEVITNFRHQYILLGLIRYTNPLILNKVKVNTVLEWVPDGARVAPSELLDKVST